MFARILIYSALLWGFSALVLVGAMHAANAVVAPLVEALQ